MIDAAVSIADYIAVDTAPIGVWYRCLTIITEVLSFSV